MSSLVMKRRRERLKLGLDAVLPVRGLEERISRSRGKKRIWSRRGVGEEEEEGVAGVGVDRRVEYRSLICVEEKNGAV